jgi:hypothetical protein
MSQGLIDDIVHFDTIYRSDGPGYSNFRDHFLHQSSSQLNSSYRENTYLPLRILLLETTRTAAKHSVNDLMLLLHMQYKKTADPSVIQANEGPTCPWRSFSDPLLAPGPIASLHFPPGSRDFFAFSTLDGALHFVRVEVLQLRLASTVNVPTFSFLKFQWATKFLIVGIGVSSTAFIMSSDSRLWDLTLPSIPSEIIVFPGLSSVCVVGDLSGNLQSFDLSCIPKVAHLTGAEGFKQPTSVILSHSNADILKIIALKVAITSLSAPADGNCLIAGTSSGDIFIIAVEPTQVRRWRTVSTGFRTLSVQKVALHQIAKEPKPVSIDWISAVFMESKVYIFANTRSEKAALLVSQDLANHCNLVKTFRVPSLRAKCPVAINSVNGHWIVLAGTDVGDLILCEEMGGLLSLPFHDATVTVVEWLHHGHLFISADVSGLLSLWTKAE